MVLWHSLAACKLSTVASQGAFWQARVAVICSGEEGTTPAVITGLEIILGRAWRCLLPPSVG